MISALERQLRFDLLCMIVLNGLLLVLQTLHRRVQLLPDNIVCVYGGNFIPQWLQRRMEPPYPLKPLLVCGNIVEPLLPPKTSSSAGLSSQRFLSGEPFRPTLLLPASPVNASSPPLLFHVSAEPSHKVIERGRWSGRIHRKFGCLHTSPTDSPALFQLVQ